jgi:anti-sigma regulatory factor (Ser/Thr protein kinase)
MQVVETARRAKPRELVTSLVLPAHPSSVRLGRHAAVAWLQFAPGGWDRDTVLLLVTEVLANAVEHSDGPLRLSIAATADRMRVEVTDASPIASPLDPGHVQRFEDEGVHLKMMKQLADRWGIEVRLVDDEAHMRVVWFECRRSLVPAPRDGSR